MSHTPSIARQTIPALTRKKGNEKIVVLTAYTARMAELLDPQVDMLLVGDSLGMVLYGLPSTQQVTMEMMIPHARAVVSHSQKAPVLVDMPFGSYQESPEQAFRNAARLMQETGCHALKLEGGKEMAGTVKFLSERGVPVMGHIGLKPQYVHMHGGYRYQGRTEAEQRRIREDALSLQEAGAFAILMECVEQNLAKALTKELNVPTIGIGSGVECDGQVVVVDDMLGMFDKTARFIKPYAALGKDIAQAVEAYAKEVREGAFPSAEQAYTNKTS